VVGISPNDAALVRLAGMLLLEQNDEWLVGRRYLSESSIALVLANPTAPPSDPNSKSVRAFVPQTGGVQHHPPHRAQRSLSMAEREEISRGVAAGSRADRSRPGWASRRRDPGIKPSSVELTTSVSALSGEGRGGAIRQGRNRAATPRSRPAPPPRDRARLAA
jgi:hypothetical protein